MGPAIGVAIVIFLIWMWRRRAAARQADAQERIAEVMAPSPPRGRYPRPKKADRGLQRIGHLGIEQGEICVSCGAGVGGPGLSAALVVCGSCRREGRLILPIRISDRALEALEDGAEGETSHG